MLGGVRRRVAAARPRAGRSRRRCTASGRRSAARCVGVDHVVGRRGDGSSDPTVREVVVERAERLDVGHAAATLAGRQPAPAASGRYTAGARRTMPTWRRTDATALTAGRRLTGALLTIAAATAVMLTGVAGALNADWPEKPSRPNPFASAGHDPQHAAESASRSRKRRHYNCSATLSERRRGEAGDDAGLLLLVELSRHTQRRLPRQRHVHRDGHPVRRHRLSCAKAAVAAPQSFQFAIAASVPWVPRGAAS